MLSACGANLTWWQFEPEGVEVHVRIRQIAGLDGLRGVAVAAVVLYHFFGDLLPGGFMGVDVFFVLSGFLITSILLREVALTQGVSFRVFWKRRLRRIAPLALFVLIITTAVVGTIGGDLAVKLRTQFFGTAFFVNNWVQIANSESYFAKSDIQVTAHYWSLAIEEQYYLIWPILVWLVLLAVKRNATRFRPRMAVLTAVMAVASMVAMALIFDPQQDPSRVYYGTDTHAFGLLLGSLVALLLTSPVRSRVADSHPRRLNWFKHQLLADWIPALAFVGLVAMMMTVHAESAFTYRGGLVIASLLTSLVVMGLVRGDNAIDEWMNIRVLRWLGHRSFSIYLWHWPIVMTLPVLAPKAPEWLVGIVAVVLTAVISEWTFNHIETPFRRHGYRKTIRGWFSGGVMRKLSAGFAVVLVGALTACGLVTAPTESSLESDLKEKSERLQKANEEAAKASPPVPKDGGKIPVAERKMPSGNKISMVGDSVMLASSEVLQEKFPGATVDAAQSRHYIAALPILQQMADAGTLREFVVLGLGTNGPSDGAGDPEMLKKIRKAVGKDRVIIYVLPYGDRDWMAHANEELIAEAKKTPNVYLANWCEAAKENDDFVDGIHPGEKGAKLYAGAVKDALKQWKSGKKDIPQSCSN